MQENSTRSITNSSSASRFTAGALGFLDLTQCRERPELYGEFARLGHLTASAQ
jgi:hypothetical protein